MRAAAAKEPEAKTIGKGSTGEVIKKGDKVYKTATRNEGQIYAKLAGVEGIADGKEEDGKIVTPHFKNVVSIDDTPKDRRQSHAPILKKNLGRLISGISALSAQGYDYNDPIQVGFDKEKNAHIFDFSMAQKDEDAVTANLGRMGDYLNEFGLSKHGEALISTSHVWQYANNPGTMEFDNESPESISAQSVVKRLGGAPKHAYYTFNKRAIPGVAQTEYNGHELVFTSEPLSQEKMNQWEIYPAYAPGTGAAPSRIPGEGYDDLRAEAAKEPEATPPAPPAPPEAPTAKGPDRRSYAERISAGESPEKIMAELDQRSDIARSQRDRPEATPAEKATAQAEIQHARNVSDDTARADNAEKMNKKAADAKSLASVEKPKITIEKSIGYSGKTGDPSYLAKISGKHNGKTFNREFQNGDEDKKAKSDAFRKKKGAYNETHEISPGELYEHAQNGTKKLLAIQPALDGGTAGQKVSFEIAELKEASKILKSFDDSETPNPNGFGANADFVKPLLAHQAKMAKKAGSYEGLTLPVVAKDLEGS